MTVTATPLPTPINQNNYPFKLIGAHQQGSILAFCFATSEHENSNKINGSLRRDHSGCLSSCAIGELSAILPFCHTSGVAIVGSSSEAQHLFRVPLPRLSTNQYQPQQPPPLRHSNTVSQSALLMRLVQPFHNSSNPYHIPMPSGHAIRKLVTTASVHMPCGSNSRWQVTTCLVRKVRLVLDV